ncbi:MAG: biotin-dependent carboxyltransferase [Gammaproteobacteria bacterium]|nr:biotin-dependent carboxyltransferase [Gammaproteobacteria bacterium]MCP5444486.1 biotin-dependent carboxyltransferase [Chromatiaceae bacterium]
MSFEVINPGPLSQIQDFGRYGQQRIGYTQGGPMDEHAFLWANRLLDNAPEAAQIEITYGGLQLRALDATMAAVTGADLGATLNGIPLAPWHSFYLAAGDTLLFNFPRKGLRSYLAVKGGLQVSPRLGSCATVMREKIGGLDGQGGKLRQGDRIPCLGQEKSQPMRVRPAYIPDYDKLLILRLIAGYQYHHFPAETLRRFFSSRYGVSQQSDRMGYRLIGAPVECSLKGIVSEGISYGAVQIPGDGQPIVLMKDRQTIGGYPKLGCIASLDAGQLAQRMPGATVCFRRVGLDEVSEERSQFNRFFGLIC